MSGEVFAFLYNFHLEWMRRSSDLSQNEEFGGVYRQTKFERNMSVYIQTQAKVKDRLIGCFFVFGQSHLSRFLSHVYWSDETRASLKSILDSM